MAWLEQTAPQWILSLRATPMRAAILYSSIGSIRSARKIASTRKNGNRQNHVLGAKIAGGTRNGSDLIFNCSLSGYARSPVAMETLGSASLSQVTQDRHWYPRSPSSSLCQSWSSKSPLACFPQLHHRASLQPMRRAVASDGRRAGGGPKIASATWQHDDLET